MSAVGNAGTLANMFIGPPISFAGLDVGELLARHVHRDERIEVDVGIDADGARLVGRDALGARSRSESEGREAEGGEESSPASSSSCERNVITSLPYFLGGNTTFQSCFMSTTVQPLAVASSSALSSLPT